MGTLFTFNILVTSQLLFSFPKPYPGMFEKYFLRAKNVSTP